MNPGANNTCETYIQFIKGFKEPIYNDSFVLKFQSPKHCTMKLFNTTTT